MEFFSKLVEQTTERFRSLAPNTRLASIAAILAILAGVLFLVLWQSDDVYEPLLEGRTFPLREIAGMTAAFKGAGLNDSRIVGRQILVPRAEKERYFVALKEADALPADFSDPVTKALDKSSFLEPRQQGDRRFKHAELTKLERTIAALDGIETVSVQYDEEKLRGFPPATEGRAMVAVRAVENRHLEYKQIETIRNMVTSNFAGLERENVTVADLNAFEAYSGDTSIGGGYALTATKRMLEREFRSKIEERLSIYPGAKVGVNVHLAVPASPSAAANSAPTDTTMSLAATLVTASIDLPKSYFKTIWRDRYAKSEKSRPDPAALANIEQGIKQNVERAVLALLPPAAPQWNVDAQVIVTSYEDKLTGTLGSDLPSSTVLSRHWPLAALVTVVLLGLLLYAGQRRQLRQVHAENATQNPPTIDLPQTQEESDTDDAHSGPNQHDELSRYIEQDPGAAAEVITEWLRRRDAA